MDTYKRNSRKRYLLNVVIVGDHSKRNSSFIIRLSKTSSSIVVVKNVWQHIAIQGVLVVAIKTLPNIAAIKRTFILLLDGS